MNSDLLSFWEYFVITFVVSQLQRYCILYEWQLNADFEGVMLDSELILSSF